MFNIQIREATKPKFLENEVKKLKTKKTHHKRCRELIIKALQNPNDPVIALHPEERYWLSFEKEFKKLRDEISTFSPDKILSHIEACKEVITDAQKKLDYFDKNTRPKLKEPKLKRKLENYKGLQRHKAVYERQLQLLLIYQEDA